MQKKLIHFIQDIYQTKDFIPLHSPTFSGNEKKYVLDTIDSTFVSSVGRYVEQFEQKIESYTGSTKAIATVNGTAALHAALYMADVKTNDLVITQPLTFVATCNAIVHMGAEPVFVDINKTSLGLCPSALGTYLEQNAFINNDGLCQHKTTQQFFKAVVPMHTFGHPAELDELLQVCKKWHLPLIEDAAESLGSFYRGKHTGTFGDYAAISFNGNKIITTGGGGMILVKNIDNAVRLKHITTTAKVPHPYEYYHDEIGFNYRLPNLNSALGCAQMESLPEFIRQKRNLAQRYTEFFEDTQYTFHTEPDYAQSNYWLNAIICPSPELRETLLQETNNAGVMTRPIWQLMPNLPMFKNAKSGDLPNAKWAESCIVNIPSTPTDNI